MSTLKAAAPSNLLMGSQFNYWQWDNAQYQSIYKAQYAVGVAEAVCKFGATEPNKDQYTMSDCITMAQRA